MANELEMPSVMHRPPREDDREYWTEVATHIVGVLGQAGSFKFIAWMLRTPGSTEYYMISDQARIHLLDKFQEYQARCQPK